ncbi:hypothetical protein L1887_29881 [Cichorium endivia]|nr:hypothetical protein L1887_29881 [Cichorium endivia]
MQRQKVKCSTTYLCIRNKFIEMEFRDVLMDICVYLSSCAWIHEIKDALDEQETEILPNKEKISGVGFNLQIISEDGYYIIVILKIEYLTYFED